MNQPSPRVESSPSSTFAFTCDRNCSAVLLSLARGASILMANNRVVAAGISGRMGAGISIVEAMSWAVRISMMAFFPSQPSVSLWLFHSRRLHFGYEKDTCGSHRFSMSLDGSLRTRPA